LDKFIKLENKMAVKDIYSNYSSKKYERLYGAFTKWKQTNKANSSIIGTTGSGKTSVALIAIEELNKAGEYTSIIIVPTKILKSQWEKLLVKAGLRNALVYVVNTIALGENIYNCDLLIVDEVDKMVTEKFKTIYQKVKKKWCLNMTATLFGDKRLFINKYYPIADEIEIEEALEEGYVSDFTIYNWGIELGWSDCRKLDNWQQQYFESVAIFGDYDNYRKFLSDANFRENLSLQVGVHIGELFGCAKRITKTVSERKKFFYNHPYKLQAIEEIRAKFPELLTVVFSESIDFMKSVKDDRAIQYHSKMTDKQRQKALDKLLNKENNVNCIVAGKSVESGMDVGGLTLGVNTSYTSSTTSMYQKIGRCIRVQKDSSHAMFINLFLSRPDGKDTTEYKNWLKPSLVGREKYVKIIHSLDEITI
jgi:superfamily II DNA or RNA helicase